MKSINISIKLSDDFYAGVQSEKYFSKSGMTINGFTMNFF